MTNQWQDEEGHTIKSNIVGLMLKSRIWEKIVRACINKEIWRVCWREKKWCHLFLWLWAKTMMAEMKERNERVSYKGWCKLYVQGG